MLLALTASGLLLSQPLRPADQANGQLILTHVVPTPPELRGRAGASLHYSAPTSLLFTVYADGRCFGLRLDESGTEVLGGFVVPSTRVDYMPSGALGGTKSTCSPYSHWQDVPGQRGLLVACCRKTLLPMALRVTPSAVEVQVLKPFAKAEGLASAPASCRADGSAADGPSICWVLHEDGSLQCHSSSHVVDGEPAVLAALSRALHKRPSASMPRPSSFPVDFFERGTCVTASSDIAFGGDVLHNSSATNAKARLSSNTEDYVSSPHKTALTLHVHNSNAEQVLVGIRVLLGSAHPHDIPASFSLFGRTIATHEGQRRWYDVPLTEAEAIAGHRQLTIVFFATHSGINVPVIDAVDVYAQSKAEFGYDAKLASMVERYQLQGSRGTASAPTRRPRVEDLVAAEPLATTLRALESSLYQLANAPAAASAAAAGAAARPPRRRFRPRCCACCLQCSPVAQRPRR